MTTTAAPMDRAPNRGTLSPASPSLGISVASLLSALGLLIAIAAIGGNIARNATTDAAHAIGIALSTAGVAASVGILFFAVRAMFSSRRSGREAKLGQVLASRASAELARQDALIAFGLMFTLSIGVLLLLAVAMNNASIQKTFFRWDFIRESALDIFKAFWLNIWMAIVAQFFVLILGLVLAIARMVPGRAGKPVRALAIAYIDTMRAVPAIIILYLIGFGLPIAKVPVISDLSPEFFAILALTLTYSAYMAEIYRSGIESIHPSQWSATRSLGFSYGQTLRYVILPQAIRRVVPPLLGAFIALQKDTSLVNIIGTMDAFNQAKFYASSNFNLSSVTVVALLFVAITIPQTRFVDWMLARGTKVRAKG
jgi:polar amino acid transport system permease protein